MIKSIPDFPDYFADELGNIYSMKPQNQHSQKPDKPKPMKVRINSRGYRSVALFKDKKQRYLVIANIVLSTFVSPRPPKMLACHGVKGKLVDTIDNVYWGTALQNQHDRHRDKTDNRGQRNHFAKISEETAKAIKYSTDTVNEICEKFSVGKRTVQKILRKETWTHI